MANESRLIMTDGTRSASLGRLDASLAVALGGSLVSALIGLAVVPIYVRYLGLEGYGVIGLLATAQASIQIFDLGLATVLNREVARGLAAGRETDVRRLLRTLEVVYWAFAGLIAVGSFAFASVVSDVWLKSERLPKDTLASAVMMIGLVIAGRWPTQLYLASLLGAQRVVLASAMSTGFVLFSSFGAVAILALLKPSIIAFLAWQAVSSLAYVLALRSVSWRVIGAETRAFGLRHLHGIWQFSIGVALVTASGIAVSQVDKLILSRTLSLQDFGAYMLAFAIAAVLYLLSSPVFNAVYPRLSSLVEAKEWLAVGTVYHLATRVMAIIAFPVAMFMVLASEALIELWTGDSGVAVNAGKLLPALAAGAALHAVMHVPYALQLATGRTRIPLLTNSILLLCALPLTVFLSLRFGAVGGAWAWLALHAIYLCVGSTLTHVSLAKGSAVRWLLADVGIPLAVAVCAGFAASLATRTVSGYPIRQIAFVGLAACCASAVSLLLSTDLRKTCFSRLVEWRTFIAGTRQH